MHRFHPLAPEKHGQLLDADIAKGTGIALSDVRNSLLELSAQKPFQCAA
ncbi:MAG: hypothetical protein HT580_11590 [Dechloromonas sp.]|nr:MAG: hypothetical protein HT580_11590 [Dechloromonas sp.]